MRPDIAIALLLLGTALILSGCDSVVDAPVEPTHRIASDRIAVQPIPDGIALTSLRRASELAWRVRDPSSIDPARAAALGPVPRHGCYLARYHAGPDIVDDYRHAFVGLDFPAAMVAASAGHDATVAYVTHAANPDVLPGFGDAPPIMRKAVCRIPQTEAARALLAEQLGIAIPAASGAEPGAEAEAAARALPAPPSELASGVLPGNWENDDGFVCPMGYNWDRIDMTTCVNSFGALSLPVVHVSVDEPGRGDDGTGGGGEPGENDGYWPDEDGEVYTPTECLQEDETMPGGSGDALCVPTGGSSPPEPEDEPSIEEQFEDLLEENPYALLDVPCDLIPEWQAVAGHEIPGSVFDRLNTEALFENAEIQRLEDASGAVINMDRYSVSVSAEGLPDGLNAEEYLNQVRMNINDYAEPADFQYYPGTTNEADRWANNPIGTMFSIELFTLLVHGSIVATDYSSDSWIFSTIYTDEDGTHPVSGNRQFGFNENDDGSITFYTQATDRISTTGYDWIHNNTPVNIFEGGGDVWENLQENIAADLDFPVVVEPITYRPDYDQVQAVLDGEVDISTLTECN